jgi:hypothetical protein
VIFAKCSGYGYIIDGHKKSPVSAKVKGFFCFTKRIFYDAAISKRLKLNKGDVPIGFNFKQLKSLLQHHKS